MALACSKEERILEERSSVVNPMEYVGIEHNKFMSEFTKKLEKSYRDNEWDDVDFLSDDYVKQFSSIMNETFHKCYAQSTSTVEFQEKVYNALDLNTWFDDDRVVSLELARRVMANGYHSKSDKTQADRVVASNKDERLTESLLQDIYDVSYKEYGSDEEAYAALEEVVKKHEKIILAEEWSDSETYALGAIAIAKYSVQFWKNYDFSVFAQDVTGAQRVISQARSRANQLIVGADVAGYVVGGVVGGASGSFAGPAGTVGGFLGGKAAGAWTGSAGAAAAITIYKAWRSFIN